MNFATIGCANNYRERCNGRYQQVGTQGGQLFTKIIHVTVHEGDHSKVILCPQSAPFIKIHKASWTRDTAGIAESEQNCSDSSLDDLMESYRDACENHRICHLTTQHEDLFPN